MDGDDKNVDDKMWMEQCGSQCADNKILMREINYDVSFQYHVLARGKWNFRQHNSIITVRILLFPLMAGDKKNCAVN